jgi:hypothetical protein
MSKLRRLTTLLLTLQASLLGQTLNRANSSASGHLTETQDAPLDLLTRSYDLGKQFVPEERGMQLIRLTEVGGKIDRSLAKRWAEEAFHESAQLPIGIERLLLQRNVVVFLAPYDPKRAFRMLQDMDLPVLNKDGTMPEDLRTGAAEPVFTNYWKQFGRSGLAALRPLASKLGDTGQYPFLAIIPIIRELSSTDPPQARSLIAEARQFYDRGSKSNAADHDFVAFIQALAPNLSNQELRSLLESAVAKLNDKKSTNGSFHVQVYTEKGSALFDNNADELLFQILPLIAKIDPQWEKRLVSNDQQLAQAAAVSGSIQRTEAVAVYGTSDSAAITRLSQQGMERARLNDISRVAMEQPAQALLLANSISDSGLRSIALSDVAIGYARTDPQRASALLAQAKEATLQLSDLSQKESALAALSRAASTTRDVVLFREIFARAFDLGEELFQEDLDSHPGQTGISADVYPDLATLVEMGISVNDNATISRVLACKNEVLQAYLLIDAARALVALPKSPEKRVAQH